MREYPDYHLTDEEAKAVATVARLQKDRDAHMLYVTPEQMDAIDPDWRIHRWFGLCEKGETYDPTPFHSMTFRCPIPDELIERDALK